MFCCFSFVSDRFCLDLDINLLDFMLGTVMDFRLQRTNLLPLNISRRDMIKKGAGALLASSFLGNVFSASEAMAVGSAQTAVNVGIFGPSHCAAPFVCAYLKGYANDEAVRINLINYPDMSLIAKDLISGKLDFGQLIVPLVFAIHTGSAPFKTPTPMVVTQIGGTNGAALMTRKGADIKNPHDFKGKTLANHSKLSVHYLLNMMFLEKQGLNYTQDVHFRVVELGEIVNEMKNGNIDSFVMPEPKNAFVELHEIGEIYLLSKYIWPNHPCCAMTTRRDFFDRDSSLARAVTRVFTRGSDTANNPSKREELVDLLRSSADYRYDTLPKSVLQSAFTPGRADFVSFPFQSSARVILDIMKRYRLLPESIDDARVAENVFLSDFNRQVMAEVGLQPPISNFRPEKVLGKLLTFSA